MTPTRILISAGEVSGDAHGAHLIRELKKQSDIEVSALGGRKMAEHADFLEEDLVARSVVGFFEVIKLIPYFRALKKRVVSKYFSEKSKNRVDALVIIDYPGFNMLLAREAKERGITVFYYITPQVWAWRKKRAVRLSEICDELYCVFEFEKELFTSKGGRAEFVGHPLLESIPKNPDTAQINREWSINSSEKILALLPGSRVKEIQRHLPLMLKAAKGTGLIPIIAKPDYIPMDFYKRIGGEDIRITTDSFALLSRASSAIVKSGTSTLEAAVAGVPFVTVYKVFPLTYFIAKKLIKIKHISMVNILAGKEVVPELIQADFTETKIRDSLLRVMHNSEEIKNRLNKVKDMLGGPGASERTASLILRALALKEE